MRQRLTDVVLRSLEVLLPGDVAESLVGDLAEEATHRGAVWLLRQAAGAVWYVHAARWHEVLRGGALATGLVLGTLAMLAGAGLWRLVLNAVPRRADHPMGLGWMLFVAVAAVVAATAGSAIARAVSPWSSTREMPEG